MENSWLQAIQQWLPAFESGISEIGLAPLAFLLGISVLSSLLVSWLYVAFYESRATGSRVHRAFPLIGLSVTAIFISIQFSLPLSLGLLGALSIVRFRTPIKEPEEIGFILLVISTSLAVATFNLGLLLLLLAVASGALLVQRGNRLFRASSGAGCVVVCLPSERYREVEAELRETLAKSLDGGGLESLTDDGDQTRFSYRFRARDGARALGLPPLVQRHAPDASTAVFFDKPLD